MDFSQFDSRARAEAGVFVPLCDQYGREPINGTDPEAGAPGFMVRGTASRSVQSRMAEMARAAKEAGDSEEEQRAAMEKMHADLMDSAERFIIRGVNIEIGGEPVGDNIDRIRAILDMTFPELRVVKDADGNALTTKAKGEDGKEVEIPRFELANLPFAKQVVDAAEDGSRFLGKPASA